MLDGIKKQTILLTIVACIIFGKIPNIVIVFHFKLRGGLSHHFEVSISILQINRVGVRSRKFADLGV